MARLALLLLGLILSGVAPAARALQAHTTAAPAAGLAVMPLRRRPDTAAAAWAGFAKPRLFSGFRRYLGATFGTLSWLGGTTGGGSVSDMQTAGLPVSSRQANALRRSLGFHGASQSAFMGGSDEDAPQPLGVSALRDMFGSEYQGALAIGAESPQELQVIYDTGSADLWVASDLCRSFPCDVPGRGRFNHSRSRSFSFSEPSMRLQTTFGSGEIVGSLGLDDVRVGPLTVHRQGIGLIEQESGDAFALMPIEGIVGLGFPAMAALSGVSLIEKLQDGQTEQLPRLQFAFYLHKELAHGGSILWGGHDRRLHEGELRWFPVLPEQLFWALELVAFSVGPRNFSFGGRAAPRRGALAAPRLIVDSGTTFFTATGEVYEAIMERARAMPCREVQGLPPLVYSVRDSHGAVQDIPIPAEEYMIHDPGHVGECLPGIINMGVIRGRPAMILGELFMRRHFAVFSLDGGERRAARGMPRQPHVGLARTRFDDGAAAFFEEAAASGR